MWSNGKKDYLRLELVGSFDLCTQFLTFVKSHAETKVSVTSDKRSEDLYRVQLVGSSATKTVEKLYGCNPVVYLDRKYARAKELGLN